MEQVAAAIEDLTFNQAMTELNAIVTRLEGNTMGLEESLVAYERGVALLRSLQVRLADAQQRVDVLMGELTPEVDDATRDMSLS